MRRQIMILLALVVLMVVQSTALNAQDATQNTVYLPVVASVTEDAEQTDEQPTPPDTAQSMVVRVYFKDQQQLREIVERLDVFEEPTTGGYAVAYISQAQFEQLSSENIRVEIDTQRTSSLNSAIDTMQQAQARGNYSVQSIPGFACYRTVEETYSSLQALATANPNLATWSDIGDTWEKVTPNGAAGYDINVLVLTNKSIPGPKPKFMLISAIHAREYATAELATRFAEELIAKYNVDADVTWLLDHYELHLVPQVNPDGRKKAETGVSWRKNTDNNDGCGISSSWGTDLNRNSNFKWGLPGASSNACDATYRGPSASSEPEVQAIEAYADSIFPDLRGANDNDPAPTTAEGVFISLHSYSELVLFPWGWTSSPAPNTTALQTLGRKFGYYNGYQVCNGPTCLYGTSGTTDDYTYGKLGVSSYTFEIGQNFFESCSFFESNILPKNMPALSYAFKSARRPYENPAGPDTLAVTANPATVAVGGSLVLTATADDTRYNSNGWGNEATQAILAARYSLDLPSWKAASTVAMNASDGAFDSAVEAVSATINTTGWSAGRHTIFVEAQDASGNWGVPSAVFVTISDGSTPTPTVVPTVTATPMPTATPVNTPTPTGDQLHLSSTSGGTVGGVTFTSSDVIKQNVATGAWSMVLDLSDVGISNNLDAVARLADGSFLLSFASSTAIAGVGTIADSDIVKFTPTTTGNSTAGTFSMYFDGSDVGLSTTNEDIDAVSVMANGHLLISTVGGFSVPGVSGNDEDLIEFSNTAYGATTSGSWSLYFDGSDVGLGETNSEDINAVWLDTATGGLYLSTVGSFTTNNGVSGDGSDILLCASPTTGANTTCSYSLYWDGSLKGFGSEDTDGAFIVK